MHKYSRIFLCIMLGSIGLHLPRKAMADEALQKAIQLTNSGKYAQSIEYLRRSTDRRTQPTRLYYSGYCYHKLGDMGNARNVFLTLVRTYPSSREAQMAETFLKQMSARSTDDISTTQNAGQTANNVAAASNSSGKQIENNAQVNDDSDEAPSDLAGIPDTSKIYFSVGEQGHMYVDASVNGRPIKCMFDTGATGFTLGFNHLRQCGLPIPNGNPQGANSGWAGRAVPIWYMDVNLKVGPITRKIRAKVQEEMSMEPLIGYAFMKGLKYEIDSKGKCMIVTKPSHSGSASQDNQLYDIPCKMISTKAIVPLRINNKTIPAMVDTGSNATIINAATAAGLGIEIPADAPTEYAGGIGGLTTFRVVEMDLRFGPISKQSFPVRIGGSAGNAIGQDFLAGYRFTIDQDKSMLRFYH